jgi:hypothetical protein
MKLIAAQGVWNIGAPVEAAPLTAVLEVSGAVLSWPVDEPEAPAHVAFTDIARADWLWRVVGDAGHAALVAAADAPAAAGASLTVSGVQAQNAAVAPLRRLAVGHWLRRWWPASRLDGISGLDLALLDAELALLTDAAQDYFTDDTLDSDAAELLRPHVLRLVELEREGDPRVIEIVRRCADLADDLGVVGLDSPLPSLADAAGGRRDDYALVAGGEGPFGGAVIARGAGPIAWGAVPPGTFDAAEQALQWRIADARPAVAHVQTALVGGGSPAGLEVRLQAGQVTGTGVLDDDGRATLPLRAGDGGPLAEPWDQDWAGTVVSVGADVVESPETRDRVRAFARARLARPGDDAFLAEILTAEADY